MLTQTGRETANIKLVVLGTLVGELRPHMPRGVAKKKKLCWSGRIIFFPILSFVFQFLKYIYI